MATFGFIGGNSGTSSVSADCERIVNLMLETIASRTGKTQETDRCLLATPGRSLYATLPTQPVQSEYEASGRGFVVAGWVLYEVFAGGAFSELGSLGVGTTVAWAASPTQLLVSNGPQGYIFNLTSGTGGVGGAATVAGTFQQITDPGWLGGSSLGFLDGYFLAVEPSTQAYTISGINDGLSWDALDFGDVEGTPENVVGMIISHDEVWFFCTDHGEIYYDSGAATFPYARLSGGQFHQGLASARAVNLCDNTVFWLGQSKEGAGICWRADGYTPERFSDYRVEAALASYGDLSQATSYPYQENGHTFWRLDVAGHTWVYDVGEKEWHERGPYNGATGLYEQDVATSHMYVFGQHIVGDSTSGNLYVQSTAIGTENGVSSRRLRRAPVILKEDKFVRFPSLRLEIETSLIPAGATPMITLRTSNDAGKTYGNDRTIPCGVTGQYGMKVEWRRGGQARRRVYEVIVELPYFKSYTNAFLEIA